MSLAQKPITQPEVRIFGWRKIGWSWPQLGLGATLVLAALLNLYRLDQNGYTNEYYAAAVRSMLTSWHNFFFNAYDPGGFISIDKPPVAFWLQTISARILGFNGVSILLPSVLAGVASVALLYHMVQRAFGAAAGLMAALALAVTPIFVVMNRHNNPESLLVLALVAGAWALSRAAEKGRLGWLMLAVALVGVGFNIKMLQAFVVLPAFYLVYLWLAPIQWWKRIVHLALATLVLAVVSLSWAVAVDLTPASERPYVGGSSNNSVINLITDYNGLGRIEGNTAGGPGQGNRPGGLPPDGFAGGAPFPDGTAQPGAGDGNRFPAPGDGAFRGGGIVAGQPGLFRMFDAQLAGEAGWLLPLALLGLAIAAVQSWRRFPAGLERTRRLQALVLWGGWLLTFMAVFSMAEGIFHSYYLVMLAPAIAALAGAGLEALWHSYRQGGWQSWLLPLALVATALFQFYILSTFADWNRTLAVGVIGLTLIAACALLVVPRLVRPIGPGWAVAVTGVALIGLMAAPLAWVVNTLLVRTFTNATLPTAVPSSGSLFMGGFNNLNSSRGLLANVQAHWNIWLTVLGAALAGVISVALVLRFLLRRLNQRPVIRRAITLACSALVISLGISLALAALPPAAAAGTTGAGLPSSGMIGNPAMALSNNDRLIAFLEANRAGRTYLVATASSQNASSLIIKTGQPVMAMGGFMGSDPALKAGDLAQLVANKTVRYFLLDGAGGMGRGANQQTGSWVQQNCQVVNTQLWSTPATTTAGNGTTQAFPNPGGPGRGMAGPGGGASQLYDCAPQS